MLLNEFMTDELRVKVFDNRTAMGVDAARDVANEMRRLLAEKTQINMIFAAAPSQSDFLAALVEEQGIDWKRVNVFHMDEYIGIGNDHPQSFAKFVKTHVAVKIQYGALLHAQDGRGAKIGDRTLQGCLYSIRLSGCGHDAEMLRGAHQGGNG